MSVAFGCVALVVRLVFVATFLGAARGQIPTFELMMEIFKVHIYFLVVKIKSNC